MTSLALAENRARQFLALTKPRVVSLIVFCAVIGMFLAVPAMPPVLGWAAVANDVAPEALLLFLIIFAWTPPHFWALALYRTQDYARAGLPMLPVTHGALYTRLQIVLYTLALIAASLLPYAIRMSGVLYLVAALALGGAFLIYAIRLYFRYSDDLARATFRYSIVYLAGLFSALLID